VVLRDTRGAQITPKLVRKLVGAETANTKYTEISADIKDAEV
jgi:hypothetical protein